MAEHINQEDLELRFYNDVMALYQEARTRCGLSATRFKQMIPRHGAIEAARRLLDNPQVQTGFTDFVLCGCRELSVEALVLREEYRGLFTEAQLARAHERIFGD